MGTILKQYFKPMAVTALALSFVAALMAPLSADALTNDVATAKSNETSTGSVLGGVPTRITWEAVVDDGEQVASLTVQLPEGSSFTDESSVKLTVLDGTERLRVNDTPSINAADASVSVDFSEPVDAGKRIRLEMYKTALPNTTEEVTIPATATDPSGKSFDVAIDEESNVKIKVQEASFATKITTWLDEQEWVQAWNSNTFLRTFLKPQVIISSIPVVFKGWLVSLLLCAIGFPLAVVFGLAFSFAKISPYRILHGIAGLYTGVVRGTPLFLQIYIAFFGLPMLGLNLNPYVVAIFVLAFNSGAYLCEIFRAGIQSIHKGQFEAARSLGMNAVTTMFSVIIPQTIRRVIPTATSEFILLYKDTSLLAAVGVMELMLFSKSVVANTGSMTPYIVAACFYLLVTVPLIRFVTNLENKLAAADGAGGSSKSKKKAAKAKRIASKETATAQVMATEVSASGAQSEKQ